jgi:Putative beta-barrel porin-2, OmpL-like. bbp2
MNSVWKWAAAGGMAICLSGSVLLMHSIAEQQYSSRRVVALDYSNEQNYGAATANDSDGPATRADANSAAEPQYPLPAQNQSGVAQANYITPGSPGTMPCSYCPCPPIPYIPYSSQYAPYAPQNFPCSYAPCGNPYCGQPCPSCPWPCAPANPYCHQCVAEQRQPVHPAAFWMMGGGNQSVMMNGQPGPAGQNMQVDPNAPPKPADGGSSVAPPGEMMMSGGAGPGNCTTCGNGCNCNGNCACGNCGCDSCNCNSCDPQVWHALGDCCWLKQNSMSIYGWVDVGIMGNQRLTPDRFNGPLTFPDRRGEGELNQAYFVMERTIDKNNCGFALGGRVDFLYGTDYFYTTAAGLDGRTFGNTPRWDNNNFLYGAAMPQMYVEAAWDDIHIKLGHFYTIIGYESVPAIGNFFYSHSYVNQYGEPFTHTGILASQPLNDCWTWSAGIDDGWDTFDADDRANFLGGLTYTDKDWGSLAFAINTGGESIFGPGVGPFANRTIYSLVWSRTLNNCFTYVLQHDFGYQSLAPINLLGREWYGINQYLLYKFNNCWSAGARIEWFRDDDGYRVTGLRPGNAIQGASFPGNFFEYTLGLNYKPNANMTLRPEVRWDNYHGLPNQNQGVNVTLPFDGGTRSSQFTYGFDFVCQF